MNTYLFLIIMVLACSGNSRNKQFTYFLERNGEAPADYVINKFKKYDLVLIGEYHRIKHDVEFVKKLFPRLYENKIYNICIEFASYEDQEKVDSLLIAKEYDEDKVRGIIRNWAFFWGYKEYMNIFKEAWELNSRISEGAPKFRIVCMNYPIFTDVKTEGLSKVSSDIYMASVVLNEIVIKGHKALIYCGAHHVFTRYRQYEYDIEENKVGNELLRFGNIIYRIMPKKTFCVMLHYPWWDKRNEKCYLPFQGEIDYQMAVNNNQPIAFDIENSPFSNLSVTSESRYYVGQKNFKFRNFCDGYIFLKPIPDFKAVTCDTLFITKKIFEKNQNFFTNRGYVSYKEILNSIQEDAFELEKDIKSIVNKQQFK